MKVRVTYYLDVTSSWCLWVEPAWAALKERYAGRVEFDWQISLIPPGSHSASREQCEWFYRRSGTIVRSPFMLNADWLEPGLKEYPVPNLVAEAARTLGVGDDRVRLALAHAGLRDGLKIGRWEVSLLIAAAASAIDSDHLQARAQSPETEAIVRQSTERFAGFKMTQRPSFLVESDIGDRAVLSGTWRADPLAAVIDSFLDDSHAYAVHRAHFGSPPPA